MRVLIFILQTYILPVFLMKSQSGNNNNNKNSWKQFNQIIHQNHSLINKATVNITKKPSELNKILYQKEGLLKDACHHQPFKIT